MIDDFTVTFQCPHCKTWHTRHVDADVCFAQIFYRCTVTAGGCGRIFCIRRFDDASVAETKLSDNDWAEVRKLRDEMTK